MEIWYRGKNERIDKVIATESTAMYVIIKGRSHKKSSKGEYYRKTWQECKDALIEYYLQKIKASERIVTMWQTKLCEAKLLPEPRTGQDQ